jgi:hypothetical protein
MNMQKTYTGKPYAAGGRKLSLLLAAFVLIGVSSCIYNNLDDCPQGIDVRFFSKTSCDNDTVYPQISGLKLFVFDQNGYLVSFRDADRNEMQSSYVKTLKARNGLFSVMAWGGLDAGLFDLSELKTGVTSKSDLLFRLQRTAASQTAFPGGKQIYYGESRVVFLPDPAEYGSVFKSTSINLQEITNRLTIQVEGLPQNGDYEVVIESANGAMSIDGSVASDQLIEYTSVSGFDDNGILETKHTILKLVTGYSTTLVIRDKVQGLELYRGDLLGTLLLKNPEVNLACDRDFIIRFTAAEQSQSGTYMIVEIWVNNWLVHSFNTDL